MVNQIPRSTQRASRGKKSICISTIRAQIPEATNPNNGPMLAAAQMVHAQYKMTAKPKNVKPALDMVAV